MGLWVRFKSWLRSRAYNLVWTVVRSRVYRKLRSIVSAALVPVAICGLGTVTGVVIAAAAGFPPGYGALAGVATTAATMIVVKACIEIRRRENIFSSILTRIFWSNKKKSKLPGYSLRSAKHR
eukprot:c19685_g1_i1 orf=383-751(+)